MLMMIGSAFLHHGTFWRAAAMMGTIVLTSSAGEVLTAAAMKSMDLDRIRAEGGILGAIRAVTTSPLFAGGIFFMAVAFFSLLFALNHMTLSLVGPGAASLTLVTNTIAAKLFLKEKVDHRRWASAFLVCLGVYLLAH